MFIHSSQRRPLAAAKSTALPKRHQAEAPQSEVKDSVKFTPAEQRARTIAETTDDWAVMGQKLGALSLVAAGASIIGVALLVGGDERPQ